MVRATTVRRLAVVLIPDSEGSVGRASPLLNKFGGSAADIVELRVAADDDALAFLLSDDAGYITGAALPVDGGHLSN